MNQGSLCCVLLMGGWSQEGLWEEKDGNHWPGEKHSLHWQGCFWLSKNGKISLLNFTIHEDLSKRFLPHLSSGRADGQGTYPERDGCNCWKKNVVILAQH